MRTEDGIYAVYDRVADMYMPTFSARNDAKALRMVFASDAIKASPDDYWLYRLAWFNPFSGELKPDTARILFDGHLQEGY